MKEQKLNLNPVEKYETGTDAFGAMNYDFRDTYSDTSEKSPAELLGNYKTAPNPGNGVLAAIGQISYRSDLQKIQMFEKAANTVLPQSLAVSLSFDVIHEETVGWSPNGDSLVPSFPHKVMLSDGGDKKVGNDQNPADISVRLASERRNQAEEDLRRAQKNRFLEKLGVKAIGRGLTNFGGGGLGASYPISPPDDE